MVTSLNICSSNDTGVDTSGSVGEKKKTKKLVIIEWLDIISDDGWSTADECQLPTFYTVGWLEHEDEKVIKISNTLDLKWQPTPVFLPGESQGGGSLVGCRLWGHTESDTTEVTWQQEILELDNELDMR